MRVKVGDQVFDSEEQPIMVILSETDKQNIGGMAKDATMYASFPAGFGTPEQMYAWMGCDVRKGDIS